MHTLSRIIQASGVGFGTSGARGLVTALTDDVCAAYVQAFIQRMRALGPCDKLAIAIDLRPSSPTLALACARAAAQCGVEVIYCGALPTPALALFAQSRGIPGLMVTGSHIPFDRNGLKFYRPDGEISKDDEQAMLACSVHPLAPGEDRLPAEDEGARQAYLARYTTLFSPRALAGQHVALYQHSSVARDLLRIVLEALGARVTVLGRADTFVPIDTEAVSEADRQRGLAWAAEFQVDAIVSTDGDADRPLIADEHGLWLRGDMVGMLTARALGIRRLAVPVSCSSGIERSGWFDEVQRTRIGSPFVIAGMQALQAQSSRPVAGFEANGGFLLGSSLPDYPSLQPLSTRDAVLPIVTLLHTCKQAQLPLSELVAAAPNRYTISDRVTDFATERSQALLAQWAPNPASMLVALGLQESVASADLTDGLRVTCASGTIVHIRPSGNAPELRAYIESDTPDKAGSLLQHVMTALPHLA